MVEHQEQQQHTANDHDEVQEQIDVCMEEACVNENPVQKQCVEALMDNDNIAVEGHVETPAPPHGGAG